MISYYFGRWEYGKKRNVAFKIILYILLIGFFIGIFFILIPNYIENGIGAYFLYSFSLTMSGIVITHTVPRLCMKFHIISQTEDEKRKTYLDNNVVTSQEKVIGQSGVSSQYVI